MHPAMGPASCSGNNEYVGTDCMIDDTRDIRIDDQGPIANDDSFFGSAISVGDWDGLNGADLVIGAYRARGPAPAPNNNGGVFAFRGAVGGGFMDILGGVPLSTLSLLDPTGFTNNNFADGGLAFADLNNNGRDEMVIGVSQCTYDDPVTMQRGSASGCIFVDRGDR